MYTVCSWGNYIKVDGSLKYCFFLHPDVRLLVRTLQQSLWPTEIQKARLTSTDAAVTLVAYGTRTRRISLENNVHPESSGVKV